MMNDDVWKHSSFGKTLRLIEVAIVFTIHIPIREPFLEIHAEAVTYRAFTSIFLQEMSVMTTQALKCLIEPPLYFTT